MTEFSLVPVDHQPDFSDVSFVPVDHDPFSADDMIQQARTQLESQLQRLAISDAPIPGDTNAAMPEVYQPRAVRLGAMLTRAATGLATLPQRAIEAAKISAAHNYGPSPEVMSDSDAPFVDPLPAVAAETALIIGGIPKSLSNPSHLVAGSVARDADLLASRSAGMYNPSVKSPRPFAADYPAGASGEVRTPLTKDIEGRPLGAPFIAGRKVVGGSDEAISPAQYDALSTAGIGTRPEGYPARALPGKKTVGAYRTEAGPEGPVRSIVYDKSLNQGAASKVVAHELGHMIDDLAGKIPTAGLSNELKPLYNTLNTGHERSRNLTGPQHFGYADNDVPRAVPVGIGATSGNSSDDQ